MWTAPELINTYKEEQEGMSQKGDVYSYGIILQEIIMRSEPFGDCHMEPKGDLESAQTPLRSAA